MNNGIYRLVFNASRGIWMVVGEHVRSHISGKTSTGTGGAVKHGLSLKASVLAVGLSTMGLVSLAFADPILPPNTIPTGLQVINGNVQIHTPVVNPANINGQLLGIDQSSVKAILQGSNFNIGSASAVNFNHTGGAGSATLIRIDGSQSIIEGTLTSLKGDIYLINQNGILFANGSRTDVHGLVASALNLADSDFLSDLGHLNAYNPNAMRPAYVWGGDAEGFKTVLVQVAPDARIKAQLGGSVMLFGPKVINQGSIETTEGQVALAAGEKVYLSYAPDLNGGTAKENFSYAADSPYRGLAGVLVEVDSYKKKDTDAADTPAEISGQVINDTMGRILAQRGNVTMASFLVNQNGRVTATSSATQKGSIRLLARDTIAQDNNVDVVNDKTGATQQIVARLNQNGTSDPGNTLITGSRTGKLEIGANSVSAILAEDSAAVGKTKEVFAAPQIGEPTPKSGEKSYVDTVLAAVNVKGTTSTDDQIFNPPTFEGVGRQVTVGDNAKIVVPGGFISLSAQQSGLGFNVNNSNIFDGESRLFLGKNTLIDAAGLRNVVVDMDRNFVEVLLTLTDLKDNPLNRDGFLYRQKVWFDIRNLPDSRVADLAGFVKQVPRSVGEQLAVGGGVKLQSEGDLVQSAGSKVDVSGGSLKFNTGMNKESWVTTANGQSYALGDAPVDTLFTGLLGDTKSQTKQEASDTKLLVRQEAAYTEGKAAGTVAINAYNIALDGKLSGGAVYGVHQRESDNLGGRLEINVLTGNGAAHDVNLGASTKLATNFSATDVLPAARINTVEIDANMLNSSGFEDVAVTTAGSIKVNAAINMVQGAKLSLSGRDIEVNKNIVARGGSISLKSAFTEGTLVGDDTDITVANGVKLDVSGNWVNDTLSSPATGRVIADGGDVSISSGDEVVLGKNSLVDVSGGGWLQRDKKLVGGDGGNISIAGQVGQDDTTFTYKAPMLNGELRGYALGEGGSLSITAPFITVGNTGFGDAREFLATPEFFKNGGFTSFNLTGRDGVLVRSNTNVDIVAKNYVLNRDYSLKATGAHVNDFATKVTLPDYARSSTSLSLSTMSAKQGATSDAFTASGVARGSVVVETGANIKVDANGIRKDGSAPSIALSAWDNQLSVDGTLQAPGGDISLTMNGNPTLDTDTGYNAAQAIWLGANARLLAAGYTRTTPDSNGHRTGTVYDGGSITLDAKKGYVVAETGSVMNVAGTAAVLDVRNVNRYTPTRIASNGGDISLSAREGMLVDSTFKASSPGGLAGSLEVRLTRGGSIGLGIPSSPYPGSAASPETSNPGNAPDQLWYVDVSQAGTFVPESLDVGESIQPAAGGLARISANGIMNGGFSDVALKSEYGVRFNGDVDLTASRSLSFNAKVIEATAGSVVKLTAPNVVIANDIEDKPLRPTNEYGAGTSVAGTANLEVNARLVDLRGQFALSGFQTAAFNSMGDVRLTGVSDPGATVNGAFQIPKGQLLTTGELEFNARQLYPTSLSDFTITSQGAGSKVTFNGTGSYDKVLSAAGKLSVNAETINQNGVLLAPFGTIALNASQDLNLNAGSVTSVSAQGALIPFGYTDRDGLDYLYDFGPNSQQFTAPPERVVKLTAPNVNQAAGSTVDISGGGDLLAYEWVPGIGGSKDVLANGADQHAFGANATNTWAIMPANNQTYASYDTQYWQGSDVKAGDAVYISGVPGLAAGYYTLMPARYALLPGAMLVSAVSGYQDRTAGQVQVLANGSTLVSGHLAAYTSGGYVQTSRTAGFVVRPGSDAHDLAQYNTTTAGSFFKANTQAQQVGDAGRFSIAATNSLVLKGTLDAMHKQAGLGAEVDIAAPRLLVVGSGEEAGQVTLDGQNYLAIDETTLNNFNAASLLLGGTRSDGKVDVVSTEVRMNGNADLAGSEVILAATDKVRLEAGASLKGTGAGATAKNLTIGEVSGADGDGALVRVAGGKGVQLTRVNTDGDRGDLVVESGATVEGDGSVLLDASKNMKVDGEIKFAKGAALAFSSGRISLGEPDNNEVVTDGLWLKKAQLDKFVDAGTLFLQSKSTIDIYGNTTFGNNSVDLTLQSAGIAGYQNAGKSATINVHNLTLANDANAGFAAPATLGSGTVPALGSGNLNINAATVVSGNNTVRLAGFDQVDVTASKEVVVQGNSALGTSKLVADQNLTLTTGRLTASNKADSVIEATNGLLKLEGTIGAQPTLAAASSQGSKLTLSGDQVLLAGGTTQNTNIVDKHAALIDMAGGQVTLEAAGIDATDHVTLQDGARISAKGSEYVLNDQTVALPAGKVTLISKNGDVDVQQGAVIDLTAAGNGDAGKLVISAVNGEAKLAGTIKAAEAGAKGKNATVSVDANMISDISQAIAALSTFNGAQSYRVRQGDIDIAQGDTITATDVKVTADTGAVNVSGKMDASGDKGGSIQIYAKNDVTIKRGAKLLAKGLADTTSTAGSQGNGGDVILSSDAGMVKTVATDGGGLAGALIDVSGDQVGTVKGEGGEVIFRAARTGTGAGNGVNVDTEAAAAVTGAKRVLVEAVKNYSYSTIGASQQTTIRTETNTFASNVAGLMAGYSQTRDGVSAVIAPGIDVSTAGDLTVSTNWTLGSSSTAAGQLTPSGGILTLRAGNDLILNGNIDYEQFSVSGNLVAQRPGSWSYRLVAGADTVAVNPETVIDGTGSIIVADSKFVRTGTGFIHATAGKDIQLGTVDGAGAAIYTEGLPDPIAVAGQMATPADFKLLITNFAQDRELYGDGGGDVKINAGGSITGSATQAEAQTVKKWLYHTAYPTGIGSDPKNPQARWWNRYDKFTNGIATLGGGDVDVQAGGQVTDLQVAAANNGRMGGDPNAAPSLNNFSELGGGDLRLQADGNVSQVLLYTGKGDINAKSGGNLSAQLALMDGQANVVATGNLAITGVSNPTISASQSRTKLARFYTYDEESGVSAVSLAGDVSVKGDGEVYPSKLFVAAPNGDVNVEAVTLFPSRKGSATLLAGNDVKTSS
ncbi:MAG: ESPR-type extended signal peptide-containing protein, partial [Candidatus Methylopumilus sp.]